MRYSSSSSGGLHSVSIVRTNPAGAYPTPRASRYRRTMVRLALILILLAACGDEADVEACEPESACSCTDGTERDTACVCAGGATCTISGDNIEFSCDG